MSKKGKGKKGKGKKGKGKKGKAKRQASASKQAAAVFHKFSSLISNRGPRSTNKEYDILPKPLLDMRQGDSFSCGSCHNFPNSILKQIRFICFTCSRRFPTIHSKVTHMLSKHGRTQNTKICRICLSPTEDAHLHTHTLSCAFLQILGQADSSSSGESSGTDGGSFSEEYTDSSSRSAETTETTEGGDNSSRSAETSEGSKGECSLSYWEEGESSSAANPPPANPPPYVLSVWRSADAVCFDVYSTVCLDEGIDELADLCGAGQAVAEWTTRAMNGASLFEEALGASLSLFKPSLSCVLDCLEKRPPRISPGIAELITTLKEKGTDVYLVSGGLRQMIEPVASKLGIPFEKIFSNKLLFGDSGEYLGFDTSEPTSRSGGKALVVRQIREAHQYKTLVMIGDGATDLEARQPGGADLFICYAGVQMREAVAREADWIVFNFQELINNLP